MTKWLNVTGFDDDWTVYIPSDDYDGIVETIKIKPVNDPPGYLPEGARRYKIRILVQGKWRKMSTTISDDELGQIIIRDILLSVVEGEVVRKLA